MLQVSDEPICKKVSEKNEHLPAYSLIRLLATFSVIVVHVATPIVGNNTPGSYSWWTGNIYEAFFRSGIPLFLMLTGALLLPKARGFSFVKNRFLRIFIPFAFWTGVFLIAKNELAEITINDFVKDLYYGNSYHFWYVYLILPIYLLLPIFRQVVQFFNPSLLLALVITCTTIIIWYFVQHYLPGMQGLVKKLIFVEYIVSGYLFSKNRNNKLLNNSAVGLLFIALGTLITLIGAYFTGKDGVHSEFFYDSVNLHLFLKAVGVWIISEKFVRYLSDRTLGVIKSVSKYSFAIFLMHPLVIEHILIIRMGVSANSFSSIIGIGITSVLCLLFAYLIAVLLGKIPLGRFTY